MTGLLLGLQLALAAVLQVQAPAPALLGGAKAPLLLALTLYYALCRSPATALACALAAGLLQDLLSPQPLGLSVACFCAATLPLSAARRLLQTDSPFTQVFFGAVVAAGVTAATAALLAAGGSYRGGWGWTALKTLGVALLGALLTPLMFRVAGAADRMVGNVGGERGVEERDRATG